MRKAAYGSKVFFNDCVFSNVSQNTSCTYNNPIWLEINDYAKACPRFGGVAFTNCIIKYSTSYEFLNTYGNINTSPGLGNVQFNNLTVIHPNASVTYKTSNGGGSPSADCIFNFQKFTSTPSTNLSFVSGNSLIECTKKNSILTATRSAMDISFPIGVSYTITGTALSGIDFNLMKGFLIIHFSMSHL